VGVVSDEEIKANKGPPVMSMDERWERERVTKLRMRFASLHLGEKLS
jgi:hypothetical protein